MRNDQFPLLAMLEKYDLDLSSTLNNEKIKQNIREKLILVPGNGQQQKGSFERRETNKAGPELAQFIVQRELSGRRTEGLRQNQAVTLLN